MSWMRPLNKRNSVTLVDFKLDTKKQTSRSVYQVKHSSSIQKTTLEQNIIIECDAYGRITPTVELDGFPQGLSERETMLKLADWLHRLGVSLEDYWSKP